MRILVICPMQSETEYFRTALQSIRKHNHTYSVQQAGVGKANAAATTALSIYNPNDSEPFDLVAVIGYAAASSYFKQGDLVMPTKALYHDANCPVGVVEDLERVYDLEGIDEDCTILTGDTFINSEIAKSLISKYGDKILFDMEATAVAQIAYDTEVPVLVMKFISDVPDLDSDNLQSFEEFVNTHTDFLPFVSYLESL